MPASTCPSPPPVQVKAGNSSKVLAQMTLNATTMSVMLNNLTTGATYNVRVVAFTRIGAGPYSLPVSHQNRRPPDYAHMCGDCIRVRVCVLYVCLCFVHACEQSYAYGVRDLADNCQTVHTCTPHTYGTSTHTHTHAHVAFQCGFNRT